MAFPPQSCGQLSKPCVLADAHGLYKSVLVGFVGNYLCEGGFLTYSLRGSKTVGSDSDSRTAEYPMAFPLKVVVGYLIMTGPAT